MSQAGSLGGGGGGTTSPLTTKGDIYGYDTDNARIPIGADGLFLKADSGNSLGVVWAAATTTPPPKEYWFAAESLQPLETNFAALVKLSGTTVKTFIRAFDDTTEEYVNGKLQVPGDIDTSGTVTFRVYAMAATAAVSKNVALTFGHVAVNDSEDFDVAYTDEDSGDKAINGTQDNVTEITWEATVLTLGWAASDLVFFRLSRPDASANDLAGDLQVFSLSVEIPRA
jgi:hypothetical protein